MNRATGHDAIDAPIEDDLRHQIATAIQEHRSVLVSDTAGVFRFSGTDLYEPEYCNRLGDAVVHMLLLAVRNGQLDARNGAITDLHRLALERNLPATRLFTFAYLLERAALDELALNETIGATSEPWPLVAQIVRRASFDMLGAYAERTELEPKDAIVDRLTTLHTRALLDAVVAKEIERAGRFGYPLALILFDVDRMSEINRQQGYGVGDRILERLGILVRQYFRQHDWVARHADDAIAVLLPRTDGAHAADLAERVRATVEQRMEFVDHRTDEPVRITLSGAVVSVEIASGEVVDPERLLAEAESAVQRAKHQGRNRIVRLDLKGWTSP